LTFKPVTVIFDRVLVQPTPATPQVWLGSEMLEPEPSNVVGRVTLKVSPLSPVDVAGVVVTETTADDPRVYAVLSRLTCTEGACADGVAVPLAKAAALLNTPGPMRPPPFELIVATPKV
jgi:hypothetical protein